MAIFEFNAQIERTLYEEYSMVVEAETQEDALTYTEEALASSVPTPSVLMKQRVENKVLDLNIIDIVPKDFNEDS